MASVKCYPVPAPVIKGNTVIHDTFMNHCISFYFVILSDKFAILTVLTNFFGGTCVFMCRGVSSFILSHLNPKLLTPIKYIHIYVYIG
jgi:hypothetical protein